MAGIETQDESVDVTLTTAAKQLLIAAASSMHQSVKDFVLESALVRAQDILPDRRRFGLSRVQWEAFQTALDAQPRSSRRLTKLLEEPSVFER